MSNSPHWEQPSHPAFIRVIKSPASFNSFATSLVSLPAGAHFASITNYLVVPSRTYETVEAPRDRQVDLNSDLFYVNHSCDPALEFDMTKMEVRVSRYRRLNEGDVLTFFYPSTEYHMVQEFDCHCKEPRCKGQIKGAGQMEMADLNGYWLNQHVEDKLRKKEADDAGKVEQRRFTKDAWTETLQ